MTDWLDRTPFPRLARLGAADRLPPNLMFVGPPGALVLPAALKLAAVVNSPDRNPESETTRILAERIRVTGECQRNPPSRNALWPGPGGGPYPDVLVLHPEGNGREKKIKVEAVRKAITATRMRPFEGCRRFLVLVDADAMDLPAASALLKTLEEPHRWLGLILCVQRPAALPATIVSRCQRWAFPAPTPAEVVAGLRKEREYSPGLAEIATAASRANPERAAELPQDRLRGYQGEAEKLATVVAKGIPPRERADLTRRLGRGESETGDLVPVLNLLRATLRDLAALASGVPALSFPTRKQLAGVAALAPPGAWAEASLHAREAHDRMVRFPGNRRMQLEWLLLRFNDIARPLEIARRRRRRAG